MSFSASLIEITLRYLNQGQQCQTARVYRWDGAVIAAATAAQVGEAWWNHYKDSWRALANPDLEIARFTNVLVREVGGTLTYGEFAIPTDEQDGTRDAAFAGAMPSFTSVGCRLSVGTGVTRPGQMRIPFMDEIDNDRNFVHANFLAICEPLAELYSQPNILGAPIATGVITPQVVTYGADNNTVEANQDVVGFVLNSVVTTQVSRRMGHGT